MNSTWTVQEDDLLRSNYGKISCKTMIVKELFCGRTLSAIYNRAVKLGLRNGNRKIIHSFNEEFWKVPNVINAYWAGEVAADGCILNPRANIYIFSMQVSTADIEHLKKMKNALAYTGDIKFYNKRCSLSSSRRYSNICYFTISRAAKWEKDLREQWGIFPRKTFNVAPPAVNDNILKLSYIAGYVDGDGTITADYNKDRVLLRFSSCSIGILRWFEHVFNALFPFNSNNSRPKAKAYLDEKNRCGYYSISGFRAMKIIDTMSRLPAPLMDRKWKNQKILEIIENHKRHNPVEWSIRLPIEDEIDAFLAGASQNTVV